jgi:tetratricopeptide (TPR) repeat protein
MKWLPPAMVTIMFFFQAKAETENPWTEKVAPAVAGAERARTIVAYRHALDVTYKADDWRAALGLADAAAAEYPDNAMLAGRLARAYWRGGQLEKAEKIIDGLEIDKADAAALTACIDVQLARGKRAEAFAAARKLEQLGPQTAHELYYLLAIRLEKQDYDGLPDLVRQAEKLIDPANGYPEIYLEEVLEGLPEFFEAIGTKPMNQIACYGAAPMPMAATLRLPYCSALINGKGPYRLIVDTGGSITLSLDDDIAEELGLKSFGKAGIRGISGKMDSEQSLVDELVIGDVVLNRVMTRTFALPEMITVSADGIIGTGMFSQARMTFDFETARLIIAPSGAGPAAGRESPLRIVGDAKLIAPILLEDRYALALLDSGADVAALSPGVLKELFPNRAPLSLSAAGLGVGEGAAAGISLNPGVKLTCWDRTFDNYSGIGLDVLDNLLSPILGIQTQVLIGMPILRQLKSCTIDYPQRRMWMAWQE